jgi:perosamine synthetase
MPPLIVEGQERLTLKICYWESHTKKPGGIKLKPMLLIAGGKVRFVDIDLSTFLSLKELGDRVTSQMVGVSIVHIGGIISPEIEQIRDWSRDRGLWLSEDCAHAHGSEWNGKRAGSFDIAGAYSFFATKTMTSAEGG